MGFVKCTTALNQGGWRAEVGDIYDDSHQFVVAYPSYFSDPADAQFTGAISHGTAADAFAVKGRYLTAAMNVTVPAITDPDIASVDVDISTDGALTFVAAVGDAVIAIPQEAMETAARIQNAYMIGNDSVRVVFGSLGGDVTGGAKSFKFYITGPHLRSIPPPEENRHASVPCSARVRGSRGVTPRSPGLPRVRCRRRR